MTIGHPTLPSQDPPHRGGVPACLAVLLGPALVRATASTLPHPKAGDRGK